MSKYLPNLLTLLRLGLTPVFIILAIYVHNPVSLKWACLVFIIASVTDWLDGYLARKLQQISDFGKLWDPLADKFIVLSALAALVWKAPLNIHWLVFAIILLREVLITILRYALANRKVILPADMWGKVKAILQMAGLILALAVWAWNLYYPPLMTFLVVWFWIVTLVTVLSGYNYLRGTFGNKV